MINNLFANKKNCDWRQSSHLVNYTSLVHIALKKEKKLNDILNTKTVNGSQKYSKKINGKIILLYKKK